MHADSKLLRLPSIWLGHIGTTRSVCCVVFNEYFTFCFSVCQLVILGTLGSETAYTERWR